MRWYVFSSLSRYESLSRFSSLVQLTTLVWDLYSYGYPAISQIILSLMLRDRSTGGCYIHRQWMRPQGLEGVEGDGAAADGRHGGSAGFCEVAFRWMSMKWRIKLRDHCRTRRRHPQRRSWMIDKQTQRSPCLTLRGSSRLLLVIDITVLPALPMPTRVGI